MKQIPVIQKDRTLSRKIRSFFKKKNNRIIVAGVAMIIIAVAFSSIAYDFRKTELVQDEKLVSPLESISKGGELNTSYFDFSYGYLTFLTIKSEYSGISWSLHSEGSYLNLNDKTIYYNNVKISGVTNSTNYELFINDSRFRIDPFSSYYISVVNDQNRIQNIGVIVMVLSPMDVEIYGYLNYVGIPLIILGILIVAVQITRISNWISPDKH